MSRWKPQTLINKRSPDTGEIKRFYQIFDTYKEIKQSMIELIDSSYDGEVHVLRSRRGEWGEWNEYWSLNHLGKPIITKQFWS